MGCHGLKYTHAQPESAVMFEEIHELSFSFVLIFIHTISPINQ